jgi:hypothetical protein
MWKQEIHKLLETNQIPFEFVQNQSVFEMLFIPQHQLYFHLIDIKVFQENDLSKNYFQDSSLGRCLFLQKKVSSISTFIHFGYIYTLTRKALYC